MYRARLFASRHSRAYERFYDYLEPPILKVMATLSKLSGGRLDRPMTWAEKQLKGVLFDCKMCGNCVLSSTGMACPMNCPKTIRNGPCGGVRANGNCEVEPDMKCVWVQAWDGAARMHNGDKIHEIQFAASKAHLGTSAWLRQIEESKTDGVASTAGTASEAAK